MSAQPSMTRRPLESVDGVLLLDKPAGFTSNQALQQVKRLLGARKAGHTGSLDPIATGLLPLCFGEATKFAQFLLDSEKRYRSVFKLGVTTTTFDADGTVVEVRPVAVDKRMVKQALTGFVGDIEQVPPMYSALKHQGRPLYELARAGVEVERESRRVSIREIILHALDGDRVDVEITCSKGTYIRSLAYDLGERLGCGAHVVELRRLGVGSLTVDQAITLDDLASRADPLERRLALIPPDAMVAGYPEVRLTDLATHYLLRGQAVSVGFGQVPGWVRLYDAQDRFLGMGQVLDDGRVAPRRLVAISP